MTAPSTSFDDERWRSEALFLDALAIRDAPFAHVVREGFINPALFEQLRLSFPVCPPASGPTGFSLYRGDSRYEQLLASAPAWATLYRAFHSQRFIDWAHLQFASEWQRQQCRLQVSECRFVDYCEDRIDKERLTLRTVKHEAHSLWVRMDIYQGKVGYSRGIHRDWARRLLTLLIYFSDHDEDGMRGGELLMHASPWARLMKRPVIVTPRENLMVAFPCSDASYHSVAKITAALRPRNYIQVHISSSVDVWPRGRSANSA